MFSYIRISSERSVTNGCKGSLRSKLIYCFFFFCGDSKLFYSVCLYRKHEQMGNTDDDILSLGGSDSDDTYMDATLLFSEKDGSSPVASPVNVDTPRPSESVPSGIAATDAAAALVEGEGAIDPPPADMTVGTLATSGMSEKGDWYIFLASGIFGKLLGIVCEKETKQPYVLTITQAFRKECYHKTRPHRLPAAAIVAHRLFGDAPSEEQLKACADALVFGCRQVVLLVSRGLDKHRGGLTSLSGENIIIPSGLPWSAAALSAVARIAKDAASGAQMLRRGMIAVSILGLISVIVRTVFKMKKRAKDRNSKVTEGEYTTPQITRLIS